MVLTGRAGLVALVCVLPIALAPWPATAFAALAALLAAAVVADVALAGRIGGLQVTRSGESTARLGQSVEAGLTVHNTGRRTVRGAVRDAWPPSASAQPRAHQMNIVAGQTVSLSTRLHPVRRGDQRCELVTVRSIGPRGLAGRQRSQRLPGQVRVLPPFLSRKHLPSRLARLRQLDGAIPVLIRGQGTEFDSLREYVVGDDVRSIDWRATARRADVVVRTWRPERDRRVVIVLDTGRTSAGRVGVDPTALDPGGWPRLDWSSASQECSRARARRASGRLDVRRRLDSAQRDVERAEFFETPAAARRVKLALGHPPVVLVLPLLGGDREDPDDAAGCVGARVERDVVADAQVGAEPDEGAHGSAVSAAASSSC